MPAIGRCRRLTPPPWARPDPGHPLSARLVACHVPVGRLGAIDLCGGPTLPTIGNPPWSLTGFGRALSSNAAATGYQFTHGTTGKLAIQPPLTIMWVGSYLGSAAGDSIIYGGSVNMVSTAPYFSYAISFGGSASSWAFYGQTGGTFLEIDGGAASSLPNPVVLAITVTTSATTLWANGVRVTSGSGVASITYPSTSTFCFGNGSLGGSGSGASNMGAVWNRALTDGEIEKLAADPFCFLRM
jgi:hypothetical protein